MNQAIHQMLDRYECRNEDDYINAIREIMQELALQGLWRGKFFEHAAFYGGTALRILYGLNRGSEDLDFSLLKPDKDFRIAGCADALKRELSAFGFTVDLVEKEKNRETNIDSAFLKANTKMQLISIGLPSALTDRIHSRKELRGGEEISGTLCRGYRGEILGLPVRSKAAELCDESAKPKAPPRHRQKGPLIFEHPLKIKLEIDIDPPPGFQTEVKTLLRPIPHTVRVYALPDLLAGKLHAVLCRKWRNRSKGRDWYDMVWYAGNHPLVNLAHLEQRMRQSGNYPDEQPLTPERLREFLNAAIDNADIETLKADVRPFIRDQQELDLWSKDFFRQIAGEFRA